MTSGPSDRERWDARWAEAEGTGDPHPFVVAHADQLDGRVLDVAGGAGRHAVWLAERDVDVTVVDVSPVGLERAARRAMGLGVVLLTLERDLAVDGLPAGPWDGVLVVGYLDRDVLAQVPGVLAPGGVFVMVQPTVRNLERHDRPPRTFLLDEGELAAIAGAWSGCELMVSEEGWDPTDRHTARVVVRRLTEEAAAGR